MADRREPRSAQDLLTRRLENTDDPALERVQRDATGKVAFPRPGDYLATLGTTGDDVLVLDVLAPTVDRLTIRHGDRASRTYAHDARFEFAIRVDGDLNAGPVAYSDARRLVRRFGVDVALESERRDLFEQATPAEHAHASLSEVWDFIPDV